MNKKAKRDIKKHIKYLKKTGVYYGEKENVKLANHLTTLLDEVDKNRWISCDDSKPAEEGTYLCHFSDGVIETFTFERHDFDNTWGVHNAVVINWMPKPAPPEELDKYENCQDEY